MKTLAIGLNEWNGFTEKYHKLHQKRFSKLLFYLENKKEENKVLFEEYKEAGRYLDKLTNESEIEIIGFCKSDCIAKSIASALENNITTFSPENYLFDYIDLVLSDIVKMHIKLGRKIKGCNYSFKKGIHIFKPLF